jgi:stage V sporulation protein G
MEVSRVSVRPVDMNRVKAIASITFDDAFVVHGLKIIEGENGHFVAMPSRKLPGGEYRDVAHPINTDMREKMQSAILAEYEKVKSGDKSNDKADKAEAKQSEISEIDKELEQIESSQAEPEPA